MAQATGGGSGGGGGNGGGNGGDGKRVSLFSTPALLALGA
jgi:hypothetical protein